VLLDSLKSLIQPGDKLIYQRFTFHAEILKSMVKLVNSMLVCHDEKYLMELNTKVRTLYFESLNAYRTNTAHLAKTFITPIDREAVHELYIRLHSACRGVFFTSRSLTWVLFDSEDKQLIEMGGLLGRGADVLTQLIEQIGKPERVRVLQLAAEMHSIRREMDLTYEYALVKLFEEEKSPATFIRRQELFSALRDSLEVCQEIAHTGENIVLTHVG
jgi:uncharacterized protein Yka (UPF0111/DUF47 family)